MKDVLNWGLLLLALIFLFCMGANYEEAPTHDIARPAVNTQDDEVLYHYVKPGETLTSIARYYRNNWGYDITAADIAAANPWIEDPDVIKEGWYIYIPLK